MTRSTAWMAQHLAPAVRIGRYLLRARAEAIAAFPASDPRHGLVFGPAEHDTCSMGMGQSAKVVDGQYMNYYLSVSMWYWRGMVELGSLLVDYPTHVPADSQLADQLLAEARSFKVDIDAAVAASAVRDAHGKLLFIPAAAVPAGTKPPAYSSMTQDTLASLHCPGCPHPHGNAGDR